jgi:hypothetical protein
VTRLLRRVFSMPNGRLSKLAIWWVVLMATATMIMVLGQILGWWAVPR